MSIEDLKLLQKLVDSCVQLHEEGRLIAMTDAEKAMFTKRHAGFDLVLGGEFGIKRLKPEHGFTVLTPQQIYWGNPWMVPLA